ncbi:MAG: sigma-70 family RNA polymerase sigma factor [Candidatus Euphemobacter frigidus]|nr:sigma-70 family RNA polymerase sigma factor [Candidatus Euphemobacter frigidus]MDP8275452.1 sigma-70 family RNA polymerase sigma factor [Candidatus Euphemobacter frigidus]
MTAADEDYELVRRCLQGEIDEFRELVEKYQHRLYLLIYGIILDREQARDLTQEVFLKAYRSLNKFKGRSRFYTWLYRIAFNLALDEKRKMTGRPQVEYDDAREINPAGSRSRRSLRPDREVMREELYKMILGGLETLTIPQRTAVILREWEGYSYAEISKIMKCSRGTVMSRLHYAREKLREHLKPYLSGK